MTYRTKDELEAFRAQDPIKSYGEYLIRNGLLTDEDIGEMEGKVKDKMKRVLALVVDDTVSPVIDARFIEGVMFSRGRVESHGEGESTLLQKREENARVKQIAQRKRYAFDENGKPYPAAKQYQYRDAVFEAMLHRFERDPSFIAYGEDHRDWGGAFACYRGLLRFFRTTDSSIHP